MSFNEINFKGKRAIVTGAGKGIGACIAKLLAGCGAEVIALSRSADDLTRLRSECSGIVSSYAVDITDNENVLRIVEEAGDVDLLVNNAGVAILSPFLDMSFEDFDMTMAVNVRAAMVISQAVARRMISRGCRGAIVNVSSQASQRGVYDHTSYCVSKGGLDQLTRSMALELGSKGIRVNAVLPTVTMTAMAQANWSDPKKAQPMLDRIPLGRFAEVEEVAWPVLFLLSDKAAMINGATLPIDGGYLSA